MDKILTVTIPSYNVAKYLPEILPTFLSEEILDKVEILIVNDGSTDNTAEIGKEYEERYPGTVRVIDKENGGHGSTINTGIAQARGKYFKVVDGDDWVDSDAFIKYVLALETLDCEAVLTPYVKVNDDTKERTLQAFEDIEYGRQYDFSELAEKLVDIYQMHTATYRTDCVKTMPQISEHCFYVDQEYIMFPLESVNKMIFLPYAIYQYRVGNINQSMSRKNMWKNRAMHKHVAERLIKFYHTGSLSEKKRLFLQKRISLMCTKQVEIYLLNSGEQGALEECRGFMDYVKSADRDIYDGMPGKKITLLKKSNFKLFGMVSKMAH